MAIERAFGHLKGRFRRLKYLDMNRMDMVPLVILTGCCLHNLCVRSNDDNADVEDDVAEHPAEFFNGNNAEMAQGSAKRVYITEMLNA